MISPAVFWTWSTTLAIVTFIGLPAALYLLHRTLRAAMAIERYARYAAESGAGVASNLAAVAALEETIFAATSLLETTRLLRDRTARLIDAVDGASQRW